MKLDGKVALITGGTSGIGRAAAKLFRDEGARVVAVGLDRDRLEETRREFGAGATVLRADLRDVGEIDELIRTVREGFGAIDVLFANAGKGTAAPLEAVTEEQVDEQLAVNFKGVFFTVQKAAPILAKGGSVVLTTSYLGAVGTPGLSVLSATKAAARSPPAARSEEHPPCRSSPSRSPARARRPTSPPRNGVGLRRPEWDRCQRPPTRHS